ncbi:MAG: methyltransferase domain-containing protein [Gammaproteobacteria bacterium]|nr:methyltransferase domain-containing protein [Gammaproteobacteria bacterium]
MEKKLIRRAFAKIAADFDATDFFHREIGARLLDRLEVIACEPEFIVNLGSGTGQLSVELQSRFPKAQTCSIDSSPEMLAAGAEHQISVCADAEALPLGEGTADLVISNLMLQLCPDPPAALAEVRRILNNSGLFLFTTLGPGSLMELGRSWATADRFTHIAPFIEIRDLGNLLSQSGFTEPVLDAQILTITYDELPKLLDELRAGGSANATRDRNPGLTGHNARQRFAAAYDQLRDAEGKYPVTLEVIFGVAWAGTSRTSDRGANDEISIPLERLLKSRKPGS